MACAQLDYSDSYVPDCWPPSAGARVPPVGTTVHCAWLDCSDFYVPELLESVRDTEGSLPVAGDVVLPEISPVVLAGTAAVPVSLPAVAGVMPSAVFAGGRGLLLTRLLRSTVTVGVTVLTDTGSEIPAKLLESVCVMKDSVSVDVDVALPEVSPVVFAGAAAVPVSLPAHTGVVILGRFCRGGGGSLLIRLLRSMKGWSLLE